MPYYEFVWTDEIIAHLGEHGVSPEDFEAVVSEPGIPGQEPHDETPLLLRSNPGGAIPLLRL
jgi:hypothetical protein